MPHRQLSRSEGQAAVHRAILIEHSGDESAMHDAVIP